MHHPTDRITHTTAFVTPVVEHWLEREIDLFNDIINILTETINKVLRYVKNNCLMKNNKTKRV